MKSFKLLLMFSLIVFSFTQTHAQENLETNSVETTEADSTGRDFKHAINMCPGGIAFGIISVNYEYLIKPQHGLVARADYEAIPKSYTGAGIEAYGYAFILNYRWHMQKDMKSAFLGLYSRYRMYAGTGSIESTTFNFKRPDLTLGINAGKRWAWKSGFNLTFALGYGYSWDKRTVDISSTEIESAIDGFENGYDFMSPFYGELSIGYAF